MVCTSNLMTLTYWSWDKMAALLQTTFSNAFSGMKMYEFRLQFHWSLFLRGPIKNSRIWSYDGLALTMRQAIVLTNDGIVYWRIFLNVHSCYDSNLRKIKKVTQYKTLKIFLVISMLQAERNLQMSCLRLIPGYINQGTECTPKSRSDRHVWKGLWGYQVHKMDTLQSLAAECDR